MLRSILFVAASVAVASLPMPASARESALTTAEQDRVVCVPLRDKAGAQADGQMCKTGRQWEVALTRARLKRERSLAGRENVYRTNPGVFQTGPSILASISQK